MTTSGDYWQDEIYTAEPLAHLARRDQEVVFDWLMETLPVQGSRIVWAEVQGTHSHRPAAADAVSEICNRTRSDVGVIHVGDSISPFGVRFTTSDAPGAVAALLEIPEHHYFLAEDGSWMAAVSFEGDLDIVDELGAGPIPD